MQPLLFIYSVVSYFPLLKINTFSFLLCQEIRGSIMLEMKVIPYFFYLIKKI